MFFWTSMMSMDAHSRNPNSIQTLGEETNFGPLRTLGEQSAMGCWQGAGTMGELSAVACPDRTWCIQNCTIQCIYVWTAPGQKLPLPFSFKIPAASSSANADVLFAFAFQLGNMKTMIVVESAGTCRCTWSSTQRSGPACFTPTWDCGYFHPWGWT